MQSKATQLWGEVLSALKKEVTAQSFETWLKPTQAVSLSDDSLTVEVPNKFFKEWLLDHYYDALNEAVGHVCGHKLRIDFVASKASINPVVGQTLTNLSEKRNFTPKYKPDVYLNPKYTFDSFVVGPSNRFAHAASSAVAESPARAYNPLFV